MYIYITFIFINIFELAPTNKPTLSPTKIPTLKPINKPASTPRHEPTHEPSIAHIKLPTTSPTSKTNNKYVKYFFSLKLKYHFI